LPEAWRSGSALFVCFPLDAGFDDGRFEPAIAVQQTAGLTEAATDVRPARPQ
jgi:hypothetical protein